jgi:hypothetical protein
MHIPIYFQGHAPIFLYYDKNLSPDKFEFCMIGNGSALSIEMPMDTGAETEESENAKNKEKSFLFVELEIPTLLGFGAFDERATVNSHLDYISKASGGSKSVPLYSFENTVSAMLSPEVELRKEIFLLETSDDVALGFLRVKEWLFGGTFNERFVVLDKKQGDSGNLKTVNIDLTGDAKTK